MTFVTLKFLWFSLVIIIFFVILTTSNKVNAIIFVLFSIIRFLILFTFILSGFFAQIIRFFSLFGWFTSVIMLWILIWMSCGILFMMGFFSDSCFCVIIVQALISLIIIQGLSFFWRFMRFFSHQFFIPFYWKSLSCSCR